ncbi:DUF4393 domain-containing protein [Frisingicoccus sp.]|uniref:DUF4393 domain-containing protein n=1 Tax=Frisingicoccus sp. TaxID=1918627 RepID=UPI002E76B89D|nr:DUF4393 domain-containing protein [Frisingicoccus sp.]MEE0752132.1 DUF4393 domain-containing protein [Frisingicoccus sp.]
MTIPIKPLDLSDSANDTIKNLASGLFSNIGTTLADCWFLVFSGISQKAEKKKLQYAYDLKCFEKELSKNISSIPESNLIEPDFQIVTQSLDASKYCISVPELRHMFASLIANTMNKDFSNYVSPMFPNILRQMTAYDATLFNLIRNFSCRPLVTYIKYQNDGYSTVLEHVTFVQNPFMDFELQSLSMSSLNLLGLLDFTYDKTAVGITNSYYDFENSPYFHNLKRELENSTYQADIQKGSCSLTPLGKAFAKVCLDPKQFPPLFS